MSKRPLQPFESLDTLLDSAAAASASHIPSPPTLSTSRSSPQAKARTTSEAANTKGDASSSRGNASTSFRNVSACNRCRLRKNRCDQELPACQACHKAGTRCVGFNPFLNCQIPRSYVYYLETRTTYLEKLLGEHGIPSISPDDFASVSGPDDDHPRPEVGLAHRDAHPSRGELPAQDKTNTFNTLKEEDGGRRDNPSLQRSAAAPQTSAPGLTFSRVMFAAVKSSMTGYKSKSGRNNSVTAEGQTMATSMRDSVFGLGTKTNIKEAPFPDQDLGLKLVELYFEHSNPQIPVLHRGEFMSIFNDVYERSNHQRTPRESYLLNIVFAIGAGIILDNEKPEVAEDVQQDSRPSVKKTRRPGHQHQPEEYHAAAIVHLENFLSASGDSSDGFGRGLEELQAVLLLAAFALLRPVAPGLWYIAGSAVRLAVDLGLHYEDGADIGNGQEGTIAKPEDPFALTSLPASIDEAEVGRRQWMRDLRRRLWWCSYTFDRLVGTVVGRPFSISDQVVTTGFPSALDDEYITRAGFLPAPDRGHASYKRVAHHYFRLRLLQSEIVQVLQYQSAQKAHEIRIRDPSPYMHTKLSSPFMHRFASFRAWRDNVHQRLHQWRNEAPTSQDAGVQFNPQFLELNYWQAVILLYRQSVTTPSAFADDMKSVNDGMDSPHSMDFEEDDEEEEIIYLRIAEAGKNVLKLYRHLHRLHLVNYTFLATHHLFMAGVSFLYAIWHSSSLRSYLDLIPKCPPAEACKNAFDRMSKATVQMCMSTTGFGNPRSAPRRNQAGPSRLFQGHTGSSSRQRGTISRETSNSRSHPMGAPGRLQPSFDMDFSGLLSGSQLQQQFAVNRPASSLLPIGQGQSQQRRQITSHANTSTEVNYFADSQNDSIHNSHNQSPALSTSHHSQVNATPRAGNVNYSPMTTFARLATSPGTQPSHSSYVSPEQQTAQTPSAQSGTSQMSYFDPLAQSYSNMSDMSFLEDEGGVGVDGMMDGDPGSLHLFGIGGMDGTHDWSEGKDVDMFGDFFFGNGGSGS